MSDGYAMYLRKSRADQEAEMRGEGETLLRHRALLTQLASNRGLRITDIYQEIVSGDTIAARPQMQRLLKMVSQGAYTGVLVTEVERLARGDTIDQGVVARAFQATNTLIVTPYRVYDPSNETDEDYFEFSLFMARREYKMITRRMQAGRAASVMEGKYAGASNVYGYRRVKLKNQKGWSLEIVPEQARIVKMIFDWYAYGMDGKNVGKNAIANRLNDMGVPSPKGGMWRASSIGNLLRNDLLRGYVTWNKRVKARQADGVAPRVKRPRSPCSIIVRGIHEPIVSQEQFLLVQQILTRNPPVPASSGANISNPFAGVLFCAVCGHAMVKRDDFSRNGSANAGLVCRTKGCATSGILLYIVEEAVTGILAEFIRTFRPNDSASLSSRELEIATCEESVKSLEEQLSRIHAFAERGVYDEETFIKRRKEVLDHLETAKSELKKLASSKEQYNSAFKPVTMPLSRLYGLCECAEEKNKLLKAVFSRIVFNKTARCHRGQDPAPFLTLELNVALKPTSYDNSNAPV